MFHLIWWNKVGSKHLENTRGLQTRRWRRCDVAFTRCKSKQIAAIQSARNNDVDKQPVVGAGWQSSLLTVSGRATSSESQLARYVASRFWQYRLGSLWQSELSGSVINLIRSSTDGTASGRTSAKLQVWKFIVISTTTIHHKVTPCKC